MKNKTIIYVDKLHEEYIDAFKYSFKNCEISSFPETLSPLEIEDLAKKISKEYSQVIFFDYLYNYYLLLPIISKNVKIKWIIKTEIPQFSNQSIYEAFFQVMEYYDRKLINEIAVLDYDLYLTFKDKYNLSYIKLDIEEHEKKSKKKKAIGIIGYDYIEESCTMNQLSAVALSSNKNAIVQNAMNVTKQFAEDYGITLTEEKNVFDLIDNSAICLNNCFFGTINQLFLYSMDNKTPFVMGNTLLLNNNEYLKEKLIVKSGDNINETLDKIEALNKKDDKLFTEYKKWRKQYSTESKNLIKEFLNK